MFIYVADAVDDQFGVNSEELLSSSSWDLHKPIEWWEYKNNQKVKLSWRDFN